MSYLKLSGPNLLLPWFSTQEEDQTFKKMLSKFVIGFVVLLAIVWVYPVPDKTREEKEAVPPVLARVVLEKKELSPPPTLKPKPKKPEPKKPEPKKPEPVKPKKPEPVKPKPKKPTPVTKIAKSQPKKPQVTQEQKLNRAKQQAANAISQFDDSLADIRDLNVDTKANNNLSRGNSTSKQIDRNLVVDRSQRSSGGINVANQSRNTGGQALSGRKNTKVSSNLAAQESAANKRKKGKGSNGQDVVSRSDAAVRRIIDRYKSSLETIYQRALRKNLSLEGRFVVELVIEPNGRVSSVRVVSSELDDPALERKLTARIRSINFGVENVARTKVNNTYTFFPQ